MIAELKKKILGVAVLFLVCMLTACSSQELLEEVPKTTKLAPVPKATGRSDILEKEDRDSEDKQVRETQEEATENATEEQRVSFLSDAAYRYAYDCLSEKEKLWYQDIEQALGTMEESVRLSDEGLEAGLGESCINMIFQCVLNDHPELFFVSGYTYTQYSLGTETVSISFAGSYDISYEEALVRKKEIEEATQVFLTGAVQCKTDFEKVQYIYEEIVKNTEYDLKATDNQNIYSVFIGKASVCQGYAKAAQYLLNQLGIAATLVQGSVEDGQGHAWNLVKVDDSFYYMDVTWGDASYQTNGEEVETGGYFPEINYDYLCITTKQLLCTHRLDNCVPMPVCTDMSANYYVKHGAYFEQYDSQKLQRVFDQANTEGKQEITIKCANDRCYQEMLEALIEEQEIFHYLSYLDTKVGYANNDEQLSMTFWMTNE